MKIRKLWLSCKMYTVQVNVDENDVIVLAAPIVRWAKGKKLQVLIDWTKQKKDGRNLVVEELPEITC